MSDEAKGHGSDDDDRLDHVDAIIEEVMRRRSEGENVSDEDVVAAHPDLRDLLSAKLAQLRMIREARAGARRDDPGETVAATFSVLRGHVGGAGDNGESTLQSSDSSRPSWHGGSLRIRCPFCHQTIDVIPDDLSSDITCNLCGSTFNLAADDANTYTTPAVKQIAHFELIERVGISAFGSVWKARDTELDRTVAVKIPRKDKVEAVELDKFLREARAAAQLKHPHIVSVHEVGRDGDTLFIVSELVRGVNLDEWLAVSRPGVREVAEICRKLALALHHAHESGVIHRDLKPGNILIDQEGQPHITDFGLAKREAGEITMTMDGQVLGTPAYMSPEQARGEGHHADRRSDVYSLGVILFELLTRARPFRGNLRMLIHQVLTEEAPSPRKFNSTVPRDLETICLKCLEKPPEQRFATAADLAAELRRFLNGEPIESRPIGRLQRAWRWTKRNQTVAQLSIAVFAAMLLAIALAVPVVRSLLSNSVALHDREDAAQLRRLRDEANDPAAFAELDQYAGAIANVVGPSGYAAVLRAACAVECAVQAKRNPLSADRDMLRDPAAEEDKHYVGFVAAVASQDALAGSLAQFADAIQAAYTAEGPHLQWRDRSSRKKLAFELLMKAAKAQARGNLNTLDTPYYEPGSDVAQKSARWLATASTMISGDREPLDNQQFRDLRYLQVLATFYASPDDKETAQQVANRTDALIDADKRYDPPIQVLLVHARSHAVLRNLPQMAGAYAMLYDACRMVPKESAPKPHEVDAHVLAPAIALLDADGISKLDEQGKVAAARLFAARGRYAHLHPSVQARVQAELKQATTSDVNVPKKAYEWFDAAVTLDPRRAEYYYGRGYACDLRHDLSYAERALRMEQNAAEAVAPGREPKDFPAADGLRGLALFYKSLTLADYDEKRAAASV